MVVSQGLGLRLRFSAGNARGSVLGFRVKIAVWYGEFAW